MSQKKDEWEEMVEQAFKKRSSESSEDRGGVKGLNDTEEGEYVSSPEEDSTSSHSTSSGESEEWAPKRIRHPIVVPSHPSDEEAIKEPSDAEEAVRAAGIGMGGMSLGTAAPPSSHPNLQYSPAAKVVIEQVPPLLPSHYEKLKTFTKRLIDKSAYGMVSSISLCPFAKDFNVPVKFSPIPPFEIPNTLSYIGNDHKSDHSVDSNSGKAEVVIPFSSLLAIISSNILTKFKQSWCIPFTLHEGRLVFDEPVHDDPIYRAFAYYRLLSRSFSSHSSLDFHLEVGSRKIVLLNFVPILFAFPGSACLVDSLFPLYPSTSELYNVDLFSLSIRSKSNRIISPDKYANGVSIISHLISDIFSELPDGDYLLVHRSDEAVCFVCTKEKINEKIELDIDLMQELPSELTLQALNE